MAEIRPISPAAGTGTRLRDDAGFALVFFALALVAIMGFAALVVDLGAWYLKADKIQRAADAAALSGVVFMPGNFSTATSAAEVAATKNGFVDKSHGGDDTIVVSKVLTNGVVNNHELRVTITDPNVPTFFAKVFGIDGVTETRSSVAEYQPPVPLGSAENSFGTGQIPLDGSGYKSNIWAAVNGYCTSKENGDEFLSAFDATFSGGSYQCDATATPQTPNATANWEYNGGDGSAAGYSYDIVTPQSDILGVTSADIKVEAYDPAFEPTQCAGTGYPGQSPDSVLAGGQTINTDYHLTYEPVPLDPGLDTAVQGLTVGPTSGPSDDGDINEYVATSGDAATCGQWETLFTIPAGSPTGEYRLQVSTPEGEPDSDGVNSYGLRVSEGTPTWARCTTDTDPADVGFYSLSCPVIQGENALSVYANSNSSSGQFYLANIDPSYAGHNLEVTLFDPGEGNNDIKLIEPDGTVAPIIWQTTDDCGAIPALPFAGPAGTNECAEDLGFSHMSGLGNELDVNGTIAQPPGISSNSVFNDRHVTLAFSIPTDYTAEDGGWWKIQYDSSGNVHDRTTWSISLSGSPIHLLPNS